MDLAPKNNIVDGKKSPSLLPMDILIRYVLPAYQEGLLKYGRETWRQGFKVSTMLDACMRHMTAFYWDYEDYDPGALHDYSIQKHHLGAAIFCLLSILQGVDTARNDLDDRPDLLKQRGYPTQP